MGVTMSEPMTDKATDRVKDNRFTVGASSMQGWRMSMEDAHTMFLELPGDKSAAFFAVFDGHGGSKVSLYASENLHRHIVDNDYYAKGDYVKALEEGFLSMDRELYEVYDTSAKLAGSTAICLLIVKNKIYCANVGDSRAVASVDATCVAMSLDHKPDNTIEYRRIVAAGGYIEANRVNGNLALSRALGDFHYKSNELLPAQDQIVSPFPDIKMVELNDNLDFILLACDGIWDVLTNEEVVEFVATRLEEEMEPGLICEQLMSRCLAPDCDLLVGCDNMTVVLLCHTRGLAFPDYCENIWSKYSGKISGELGSGQMDHSDHSAEDYHDVPQEAEAGQASDPVQTSNLAAVSDQVHASDSTAQVPDLNQVSDLNQVLDSNQVSDLHQVPEPSEISDSNQSSDPDEAQNSNQVSDTIQAMNSDQGLDSKEGLEADKALVSNQDNSSGTNGIASHQLETIGQSIEVENKKLVECCEDVRLLSLESTQNKEIV